ncbi:MAG: two-component system, NarL family, sensor histidine kinase BarA [Thermodesulfobacteriota bacterium]|nr:two-component system, NarL family, sensor histidine kinase BarA [Thermodesulfobacteriota bacterium]
MSRPDFAALAQKVSFKFLVITGVAVTLIFTSIFLWFSGQQERLIKEQLEKQAVILHKQIVLTRLWASLRSPVLVPEDITDSVTNPGGSPKVIDRDGRAYVNVPPSILTKQLSELASKDGLYSFRITNSSQINPENAPDTFEVEALEQFRDKGKEGFFRSENVNGQPVLRYAAPLLVNESCLKCHSEQGYVEGDVGGCLSVFIPMDKAINSVARNQTFLVAGGTVMGMSLLLFLFFAARFLVFKRLSEIRAALSLLTKGQIAEIQSPKGDELKEISDLCTSLNVRVSNHHQELERRISEATKDLSETNINLEAANRDLQRLNNAKTDFFSSISHELRTPLTSIKGAADLISRKGLCVEPAYLDIIKRNTEHLMRIVLDFVDYSRIEAGQFDLKMKNGSLTDLIRQSISSQRVEAEARQLMLVCDIKEDLRFFFDEARIYQLLTNLLSNAVRFSPDHGQVLVDAKTCNGDVHVSVSDSGPGIDPKYHSAIFEKFFQIPDDCGRHLHEGSAGIGLAICRGIIEKHGGKIWLESQLGLGSTFIFSLPFRTGS